MCLRYRQDVHVPPGCTVSVHPHFTILVLLPFVVVDIPSDTELHFFQVCFGQRGTTLKCIHTTCTRTWLRYC